LLATLEEQLANARMHEQKMREALSESLSWSLAEDREWIAEAVTGAEQMVGDAEARLAAGRLIVARTIKDVPR
jgi:hypothetical protein